MTLPSLQRQRDPEVAALADFAADADLAAVFFGDSSGHGQADASAVLLRRVVGGENLRDLLGRDAAAGVDDVDDRVLAADRQRQDQVAAAFRDRLQAVDQQVQNGLLDQLGVDVRDDGGRVFFEAELHALELGLGGEKVDKLLEQRVELRRLSVQFDPA